MATSAAPGFLTPIGSPIPYDDALLDLLQPIIAGIGGYPDPTMVRPGWQFPDTPNMPEFDVDWVAFRIPRLREDTFNYEAHVDSGQGYDVVENTEEHDLLISCYGPKSQTYAKVLRNGFKLAQNRWYLQQIHMDLLSISEPATVPSLLHGTFQRRVDMTVTLRRYTSQKYGVLTVIDLPQPGVDATASTLDNGQYLTNISPA